MRHRCVPLFLSPSASVFLWRLTSASATSTESVLVTREHGGKERRTTSFMHLLLLRTLQTPTTNNISAPYGILGARKRENEKEKEKEEDDDDVKMSRLSWFHRRMRQTVSMIVYQHHPLEWRSDDTQLHMCSNRIENSHTFQFTFILCTTAHCERYLLMFILATHTYKPNRKGKGNEKRNEHRSNAILIGQHSNACTSFDFRTRLSEKGKTPRFSYPKELRRTMLTSLISSWKN